MAAAGISVVVPAYNEAEYLPATLASINQARGVFSRETGMASEVVVVNNCSTDQTGQVAQAHGAVVIDHPVRNIASVRNAGLRNANFSLVVTIDADCILPTEALLKIWNFMADGAFIGGALGLTVITDKFSRKILTKSIVFLAEKISGINGAMFCFWKTDALAMGGFREDLLIAEDRAFALDLKKLGREKGKKFCILKSVQVKTWDRKSAGLWTILPLLVVVMRAITGRKQRVEELDYWYRPER